VQRGGRIRDTSDWSAGRRHGRDASRAAQTSNAIREQGVFYSGDEYADDNTTSGVHADGPWEPGTNTDDDDLSDDDMWDYGDWTDDDGADLSPTKGTEAMTSSRGKSPTTTPVRRWNGGRRCCPAKRVWHGYPAPRVVW
jgi:hypothetical protein